MAVPTRNEVFLGIAFVFVGVVYALSNRWQRELVVQGVITRKPHKFDHLFVMWALQQVLQLSLLLVWKFMDSDWFGCARFRHGERNQPGVQAAARLPANNANNEPIDGGAVAPPPDEANRTRRINKKPSKLVYFPPAFFALAHILLLYFGLKLTYSSSFIMLKGTVVLFTALLSLAFLAQQLRYYIWFGVVVATVGFAVSGISDYIHLPGGGYEKYGIAAGDLLILMAQIMFATKIIYEEKFIRKHSTHPMVFLGCEGVYGSFFAIVFLLVFNFVDAVQYSNLPNGRLEDVKDFGLQFYNSWHVMLAVLGSLGSYILYIYLGMFLIRDQGALPRIVIETFVWSIYWTICLFLRWENFFIAQVPGLCVTVIGALIYAKILPLPFSSCLDRNENNGLAEEINENNNAVEEANNDDLPQPDQQRNDRIMGGNIQGVREDDYASVDDNVANDEEDALLLPNIVK